MNEEESRVQSYLLSQGQKYSFIELLPRVIKSRIVLIDEVGDVEAGGLEERLAGLCQSGVLESTERRLGQGRLNF